MIDLSKITGFEWDKGNKDKNLLKHGIYEHECEQVFTNKPLLLLQDDKHSLNEKRYRAVGETDTKKKLFVILTIRADKIRIISARCIHKEEIDFYNKLLKQ